MTTIDALLRESLAEYPQKRAFVKRRGAVGGIRG
jgi:hypothetical protein